MNLQAPPKSWNFFRAFWQLLKAPKALFLQPPRPGDPDHPEEASKDEKVEGKHKVEIKVIDPEAHTQKKNTVLFGNFPKWPQRIF